jgi:hypothetical protein
LLALVLLAMCLALVGAPSAQAAPPDQQAALLPVQVHGELDPHALEQLEAQLEVGLGRSDLSIVGMAAVRESAPQASRCEHAACAAEVAAAVGSAVVLRATVRAEARDYDIKVEVLGADDGSVLQKREARCEICGTAEVAEQLSNEAAALVPFIVEYTSGRALLEVRSQPEGANVTVDGKAVGTTPFSGEVLPGDRVVEVAKQGYTVRQRQVAVAKGTTTVIEVELDPIAREALRPHAALGWAPLGVGVAAIGGGLALIVLEENPVTGRCDDPSNIDEFGTCRYRYRTLEGGIVLTAVGVAGIVAGAVVLGIRAKRRKASEKAALLPTIDGFAVRF